jgi:hypothetical protein
MGNLRGLFGVAGEYGLYAGTGVTDADTFIRLGTATPRFNNLPLEWWSGGRELMRADISQGFEVVAGVSAAIFERSRSFSFRQPEGTLDFGGMYAWYYNGNSVVRLVNAGRQGAKPAWVEIGEGMSLNPYVWLYAGSGAGVQLQGTQVSFTGRLWAPGGALITNLNAEGTFYVGGLKAMRAGAGDTLEILNGTSTEITVYAGTVAVAHALTVLGSLRVDGTISPGQIATFGSSISMPSIGIGGGYRFAGGAGLFGANSYIGLDLDGTVPLISRHDNNDSYLRLGIGNPYNRNAYVDLFADGATPTTWSARLIRSPGANGSLILANAGAGPVYMQTNGATWLTVDASGNAAFRSDRTVLAGAFDAAVQFRRDGIAGSIFVAVTPYYVTDGTGTTWNGTSSRAAGNYNVDPQGAWGGSLPAELKALVVQAGAKWSAASDGSWILAYPYGGSGGQASMSIRAQVANVTVDAFAIIPVGVNGDITLSVAGATANGCYLRVIGYFM